MIQILQFLRTSMGKQAMNKRTMNKRTTGKQTMNKQAINFWVATVFSIAMLMPSFAFAEGFALTDWSARGGALAGGLVARGGDASAVAYNPAAITELPGTQIMIGFELIIPTNTIDMERNGRTVSTTSEDLLFVVPHGYVTHKVNDQFSLGFGIFSRFGLGNEYDQSWAGNQNMYYVKLETVTANPVVAWRFNDSFSIAAGLEITGAKVALKRKAGVHDFSLDHDGIEYALGFNLAAHYRINEKWNAGLTYRSGMEFDFDGTATITPGAGTFVTQGGKTSMSLPDHFAFALSYAPIKKLSFEAQMGYFVWSAYKDLDFDFETAADAENPKHWKDTYVFSLSAEYQALEWLTLRTGILHETSPIPAETAEYMTPTNGRWKYSAGIGVQKNNWTIDAGYIFYDLANAYYHGEDSATTGVYEGQSRDTYAHSFMLTFGYKF